MKKACLLLLYFFITPLYAANQDAYPFTSTVDTERFQTLTQEIRCVVCQNQNIADSNAPLANDLREKVYKMVIEKKSNDEIKNYLVKRYGEFILLEPRFNKLTMMLWLFPLLGLAFVFYLLFTFHSKNTRRLET